MNHNEPSRPDSYGSRDECIKASRRQRAQPTNPRYSRFRQAHFTAGDEEQFDEYRDASNGEVCVGDYQEQLKRSIFAAQPFTDWEKYKNLEATAVIDTFRYIFQKFKKGLFIKIKNNKLVVFLPFSNASFRNEWSSRIQIDDLIRFLDYSQDHTRFRVKRKEVRPMEEWYANNCLLRYDYHEGDSNVGVMRNMFLTLCDQKIVPDIELFINRRDFPILSRDGTEAYYHLWGRGTPLVSHDYPQYSPVLSMSRTDEYADILMPTHEDWARVQNLKDIWFTEGNCRDYTPPPPVPWEKKTATAVFRGATTGCGVTIETNPRLKLAYLATTAGGEDGVPYLDAGITKWQRRPRKLEDSDTLQTINVQEMKRQGIKLVPFLSREEQYKFKYVINIDGHVSAFRLSVELGSGSVVLLVDSPWKIWYKDLLIPYEHYVPISEDLSDLIERIQWCRKNDDKCRKIVANAHKFFKAYLQEDGILDYLQTTLIRLKQEMGVYLYNQQTPLDLQIQEESNMIDLWSPKTEKHSTDATLVPDILRCYGLLEGIHWVVNLAVKEGALPVLFASRTNYNFRNRLGTFSTAKVAGYRVMIKSTSDRRKKREHIHEAFVGTKAINKLLQRVPNFTYTFGIFGEGAGLSVINEFIEGETLNQFMKGSSFKLDVFLFILAQICLALQVAQNRCGLVHHDLTPWNIVLYRLPENRLFDYPIGDGKVIRVSTNLVPVIIDYGKSHVIVDRRHHGFINMFDMSTVQDILTLLVKSLDQIATDQRLSSDDSNRFFKLANFLTGTEYRQTPFKSYADLKQFLDQAKTYSRLISSPKYELEERTPMDLYSLIIKIGRKETYPRAFREMKVMQTSMDQGNGRQVFDYILSSSFEERTRSYYDVFVRLKHATIPQPNNVFFVYFAAQRLAHNLSSVLSEMGAFLRDNFARGVKDEKGLRAMYARVRTSTISFLDTVYQGKIDDMKPEEVMYEIVGDFGLMMKAPYDEETFLVPKRIEALLDAYGQMTDLSGYKALVESVFLVSGKYALKDDSREFYLRNFSNLLGTSSLNMLNNTANQVTLAAVSRNVYALDSQVLIPRLADEKGNCQDADTYVQEYAEILSQTAN